MPTIVQICITEARKSKADYLDIQSFTKNKETVEIFRRREGEVITDCAVHEDFIEVVEQSISGTRTKFIPFDSIEMLSMWESK